MDGPIQQTEIEKAARALVRVELKAFAGVVARALLMIVQYLNKAYELGIRLKESD